MPKYLVTVKYTASTIIEAPSSDEATDIALEPDAGAALAEQLAQNGYDYRVVDVEELDDA